MKIFDQIKITAPKRNKFDLSHERKMSMNMGELVPIVCQEIVPGDSFRVNSEILLRMAPMLAPIMHRVNVFTHYFFVPNRIIWNEWEDFITAGANGLSNPVHPQMQVGVLYETYTRKGSLLDYFGIPPTNGAGITNPREVSLLPFRAYQTIYNEYYRDQNLINPIEFSLGSGGDTIPHVQNLLTLRKRAWEKDYLTSALPFAQRGGSVSSPLDIDVTYRTSSDYYRSDGSTPNAGPPDLTGGKMYDTAPASALRVENIDEATGGLNINELRRSVRLQEWLEKNARAGARYVEQILAHFGVRSSDARLQRPEYLGGGKSPVVMSEVLSTAETTSIPQGNMAGHGLSVGRSNTFSKSFEEHGFVIGIMSVLPKTAYQQNINKMWRRFDRFDYFWPEFANIGEQAVKTEEAYHDWYNATSPDSTFGFQSRYAEYKYQPDTVHGDFRDNLAYWHEGRIFNAAPVLNESFVTADPSHRIFAVDDPDIDKLYVQIYNRIDALRPMPYFGTPQL